MYIQLVIHSIFRISITSNNDNDNLGNFLNDQMDENPENHSYARINFGHHINHYICRCVSKCLRSMDYVYFFSVFLFRFFIFCVCLCQ